MRFLPPGFKQRKQFEGKRASRRRRYFLCRNLRILNFSSFYADIDMDIARWTRAPTTWQKTQRTPFIWGDVMTTTQCCSRLPIAPGLSLVLRLQRWKRWPRPPRPRPLRRQQAAASRSSLSLPVLLPCNSCQIFRRIKNSPGMKAEAPPRLYPVSRRTNFTH